MKSALRSSFIFITFLGLAALTACSDNSSDGDAPPASAVSAFRWDVSITTNGSLCVLPDLPLQLTVLVYDKDGDLISNPSYNVTSDVTGSLEKGNARGWIVRGEGNMRITVTYTGPTESNATITPMDFNLVSDVTPPQIQIVQPTRGAMLIGTGNVRIQGQVTDSMSLIQSVVIDGAEQLGATAGLNYVINATPQSHWGLNIVEVVASDSCGNIGRHAQSYLLSEQYRPPATTENVAARVPAGQSLKLTQEAVDDLDRTDLDDMATLVERYLERNLNTTLTQQSNGLVLYSRPRECVGRRNNRPRLGSAMTIASPGITVTAPRVRRIDLQSGRSQQNLSADTITVPIRIDAWVPTAVFRCQHRLITVHITLSAAMESTSNTTTSFNPNGEVNVIMSSIQVDLTNVGVTLTGNSLIDNLISRLLGTLTGGVEASIEDTIRDEVPRLLADIFGQTLTGQAPINAGQFNLTLNAATGLDSISVRPDAMTQTAYAQLYPSSTGTPYPAKGAIARQTTAPDLAANPGPVTYAIDDNLINQGMWTLWHGGAMEIPDLIGFPGITMQVSALLPPVLMPGAQPADAALGLGDLKVVLNLNLDEETIPPVVGQVQVEAYASVVVEGAIEYDGIAGQLRLRRNPGSSKSFVQFTRISNDTGLITDLAMLARIREYAGNRIAGFVEQLADGAMVSAILPPLRFAFAQPVVGGTISALMININTVTRGADHVVLDMSLTAEDPPNPELDGYLKTNNVWTQQDLIDLGIPYFLHSKLAYKDEPAPIAPDPSHTITVGEYRRSTRPDCELAGDYDGKPKCLTRWEPALKYGWYCGARRPLVDWLNNPTLDPVDYCCRLHDRNLFDGADNPLEAFAPANACGFAMCLSKATGYPSNITSLLPDVEHARRNMFDKTRILCGIPAKNLPPVEIKPLLDPPSN